jgi:chromate reductase, NAD(P)H dehydrogenase (quinone)
MRFIRVAAFSGSLRRESYTTKLVKAFQKLAPESVKVQIVDIGKLPLLNQDLESDLPESVQELHGEIERAEAILLATPEYNRSYSPVLKNALDWGSRPEGTNKWKRKPVAVTGCTPYTLGAFGAQHHLRQVLVYLDMPTLQQPEFYLEKVAERFNAQGELTDDQTRQKIGELWAAFVPWIQKLRQT